MFLHVIAIIDLTNSCYNGIYLQFMMQTVQEINCTLFYLNLNQYAEASLRIAKIISSVDVFFLWLVMLSVGVIASKG